MKVINNTNKPNAPRQLPPLLPSYQPHSQRRQHQDVIERGFQTQDQGQNVITHQADADPGASFSDQEEFDRFLLPEQEKEREGREVKTITEGWATVRSLPPLSQVMIMMCFTDLGWWCSTKSFGDLLPICLGWVVLSLIQIPLN